MKTAELDLLEKSHLSPAQARAILQVVESELTNPGGGLATKADILGLTDRFATKADFEGLEHKFATKADFQSLEQKFATKADLQVLGDKMHGLELKFEGLRTEIQKLRADMIGEIKSTVRWNFAFWATQLAVLVGILKLLK